MTTTAQPTVVSVLDFGADPTGEHDSAPAVWAALAEAGRRAPAVVDFPTGTYLFRPEGAQRRELYVSNTVGVDQAFRDKSIGVLVEGLHDVRLQGNGSALVFAGRQTTIAVIASSRIVIEGFSIDFDVPTVIDATVVESGLAGGRPYRVLSIPSANPFSLGDAIGDGSGNAAGHIQWRSSASLDGTPYWTGWDALVYTQIHDPAAGRSYRADNPVFTDVVATTGLGDGLVRLDYGVDAAAPTDQGLVYQMRETTRDHPGILVVDTEDVTFRDLDVRYLHGFGLVAQMSSDLTVDAVRFEAPRSEGRYTAGFADFLQFSGVGGTVTVTDCVFDNPHDDPINIHGTFLEVDEIIDARTVRVSFQHDETGGFPQFRPGHLVSALAGATQDALGDDLVVESVDGPDGFGGVGSTGSLLETVLRFRDELPEALLAQVRGGGRAVLENTTLTPEIVIRGSVFRNSPVRCVLATSRKPILIADNVFERSAMPTIFLSSDAGEWFETGPSPEIVITGNEFIESGGPAITLEVTNTDALPAAAVYGRLDVRGNRFVLAHDRVLEAENVESVRFEGNELVAAAGTAGATENPPTEQFHPVLALGDVRELHLALNHLEDLPELTVVDSSRSRRQSA